jgi:alanyl-tRNA synthetase
MQQAFFDAMYSELRPIQGVSLFTSVIGDTLSIYATSATPDINAGEMVKAIAPIADARGGGRPDRAQAGSKSVQKNQDVLNETRKFLEKRFKK